MEPSLATLTSEVAERALDGDQGAIEAVRARRQAQRVVAPSVGAQLPAPPGNVGEILGEYRERVASIRAAGEDLKPEAVAQRIAQAKTDAFARVEVELGRLLTEHERATARDIAKVQRQASAELEPAADQYELRDERQARLDQHRAERAEHVRAASEAASTIALLQTETDGTEMVGVLRDAAFEAEASPVSARQFGRLAHAAVARLKHLERTVKADQRPDISLARGEAERIRSEWRTSHPSLRDQANQIRNQRALEWHATESAARFALNASGWRIPVTGGGRHPNTHRPLTPRRTGSGKVER